jgi:amidase
MNERTYPSRVPEYGEYFRNLLANAAKLAATAYAKAMQLRADFNGRLRSSFRSFDILACPTTAEEAPVYDPEKAYEPDGPGRAGGVPIAWLRGGFTMPYDFSGYPTLSLPCGQSPEGMPLSLQLVGKPLAEARLLQVGQAYEDRDAMASAASICVISRG